MKIISAKVLDATHLELKEPIPAKTGDVIEISIPDDDDDEDARLWKLTASRKFLSAYDADDSIYDNL